MFNSLKDFNFQGKRTLVRCDFNVPIAGGKVLDDFKIQRALQTLNYLKKAGAKIILLSHLGRPDQNQESKRILRGVQQGSKNQKYTLEPVASKLEELLKDKVRFSRKCVGWKVKREVKKLKPGDILLLENLRFKKGEEGNDEKFAKALAMLGDVYVAEAFAVCHRNHASVAILPKLLPHFVGFEFEKEIEVLSQISQNPEKPLVVIIGGVKIGSKIKVIEKFLKISDHLLFGGQIANIILRVKGICLGKPWPEQNVIKVIEKLNLTDTKIHLPVDVVVSPDETGEIYIHQAAPGSVRKDEGIFDIGKETIQTFSGIIKSARTLFWSGPLGFYENEKFIKGTEEIGRAIARAHGAFRVVGGGDTVAAVRKFNLLDKFSYVSTGGSAMLAFLAGEKLPGIEALK